MHEDVGGLRGRVVMITGAGRARGIGRGIACRVARAGARVVLTDLVTDAEGASALESAVADCREVLGDGGDAVGLALDVTNPVEVDRIVATVVDQFGELYGLVNNAGLAVAGSVLDTAPSQWQAAWNVNVMGMVHCLQSAAPHLAAAKGAVVNTSSLAGLGATPGLAAYTTTKFAVTGFTKAAAADLGPSGVRVNAVCPGLIDTQMGDAQVDHLAERWAVEPDQARAMMVGDVPAQRFGTPDEVAEAVAFLLDPAAGYLTGVALPVAGGLGPGL